jgi:hypothetical protein
MPGVLKSGTCGAAGPASAPPLSLGRPARRTPGHTARPLDQRGSHVTQTSARPAILPHRSLSSSRSWPSPSQVPEASTLASASESPGACETQPGPPQACTAREATGAAARSPSNLGPDDRRSWGRSAHTCRCSRPRHGRPRCGPAGSAGPPRCRDRADRRPGLPRPPQPRCAATGHGDRGDAVRRQRTDG